MCKSGKAVSFGNLPLMLSRPVTESVPRVAENFSTFSGEKDGVPEHLGASGYGRYRQRRVGYVRFGSKHRGEVFGFLSSGVCCAI